MSVFSATFAPFSTQFYLRLNDLNNALNMIRAGLLEQGASATSRTYAEGYQSPLGAEFQLAGQVYSQAANNADAGLDALSTVSTSLTRQGEILSELNSLATTAADVSTTFDARVELNTQAISLVEEYNSLNETTAYNGLKLTDGSTNKLTIQLGYGANSQFSISLNNFTTRQVTTDYERLTESEPTISLQRPQGFSNGDINGDGLEDVLVRDGPGLVDKIYALRSGATGVNGGGLETEIDLSGLVNDSIFFDVNDDGNLDALAATSAGLEVAYGTGTGSFGSSSILAAGNFSSLEIADTNGDGARDLVGVSALSGDVTVLTNQGGGSYSSGTFVTGISGITSSVAGDIDADGYDDLAFIDSNGALYSLLGAADGSLGSQQLMGSVGSGTGTYSLAAGEFNSDGRLDFVVAGPGTGAVFFGQSDRTVSAASSTSLELAASSPDIVVADLNGDGRDDIVAKSGSRTAKVFSGDGNGNFETVALEGNTSSVGIADVNGDGAMDIVGLDDGLYLTRIAQTSVTTSIAYLDLTSRNGGVSALSRLDEIQSNLSFEIAQNESSTTLLSSRRDSLSYIAGVNYATAGRLTDAYVTRNERDAGNVSETFTQYRAELTAALIRTLFA